MSFESFCAILFLILLTLFVVKNRKKIELQKILFPLLYFAMYKTKIGLKSMDDISKKYSKFVKYAGYVGIAIGFIGMAIISYLLVYNLVKLFVVPTAVSGVGLVLPFKVKGGFFVPFFYWIISIFILAIVHEFSHGVLSRLYKIKIKSSGFAFLAVLIPILPAAFVEPDEKILVKKKAKEQLSIFAAGPFANVVLGILCLAALYLVIAPVVNSTVDFDGVKIVDFLKINGSSPAEQAGMQIGDVIKFVDDKKIEHSGNLTDILINRSAGDRVRVMTDNKEYSVTLVESSQNETRPYLGVNVEQNYGNSFSSVFMWFAGLIYWLYLLNIGIGLFNLLPLGPIDGGRMLKTALDSLIKNPKKADKAWKMISLFFLAVIIINLLFGFFR